ncbi:hypothetical protein [Umezakia ovalisporum]|jgi:hypothetical protein|uniref:Uncharacterized protein n=2 Tax=Umezakia ovalisporum TaxID=75695 RepID=A0AA43KDR1_9CYAN|nr:hypothetical protein [Umezakia ovalisporum]MBI1241294.1 hypothetical protein [Nostoc sp. RI_552]MDH6055332.1 hypothetical protein [Umezakia ovalisporum FSS-43]MDH6062637.1 hypothetical protein [Umezakia ovalisporum FSS-62]MDH6071267.1 hypothetical protein [Umezakia ovalisporum CobakiLakeA]MDH6073729.1 hypothetical protein [Umezakia ovalisporum CS-1034]
MSKNLSFIQSPGKPWQTLTALIVVGSFVCNFGVIVKSIPTISTNLFGIKPALGQRISPGDIWKQVYQKLPDLPKENHYISKETGQIAENNTLASRLITYHIYKKGRAPNYRFDWKLTLADYLNANEIMYDHSYPGHDTLRQNPLEGDRAVISKLNRQQRNTLVQILTDIFNPNPHTK